MIYVKFLSPLFTLIIALMHVTLQERWGKWHDGRTKKHKWIIAALVCLMFISTCITCVIVWNDDKKSSRLTDKVDSLGVQVQQKSEQIIALSKANAILTEGVSRSITGGNSFSYYLHGFTGRTNNTVLRMLMHVGEYPLHDLRIRIVDGNKLKEIAEKIAVPIPISEIEKAETRIQKPTFFKSGQGDAGVDLEYIELPVDKDYQSYSIFFTARNGEWHQQVSLRRVDDKWKLASSITGENNTLLMPDEISSDFPRDDNGNVMW